MKKHFIITVALATWIFFFPFVLVNCGSPVDEPYALSEDVLADPELALSACQEMEYLVDECIDILRAEEERLADEAATVAAASASLEDFILCQSQETIATLVFQTTTDTLDCEATITNVIDGVQACENVKTGTFYKDCAAVEAAMSQAQQACDAKSTSVTVDFCSSLSV